MLRTDYEAVPIIMSEILAAKPSSILDLNIGLGRYGLLIKENESFPNPPVIDGFFSSKTSIPSTALALYDHIYTDSIPSTLPELPCYDCIFMAHGWEHFSKAEGLSLLRQLWMHCRKTLVIIAPFYLESQESQPANEGAKPNSYFWSLTDFQDFPYTYQTITVVGNRLHVFSFSTDIKYVSKPTSPPQLMNSSESKPLIHTIPSHPLTIAYLLPSKNITGGMKMLLQQMYYLKQRGYKIIACGKDFDGSHKVLPSWFPLTVNQEVCVPVGKSFCDTIPSCDLIVVGWVLQLLELSNCKIPVLYWEQGHECLFGDLSKQPNPKTIQKILKTCYNSPHTILSVSSFVSHAIEARYGRKTALLTNGIDTTFYCPAIKESSRRILLVGNPYLSFKGFETAFLALTLVWHAGYSFEVDWVAQARPPKQQHKFPLNITVAPTQSELVQHYQQATLLLFTSWYEGFGMPPLEAMACGTPVVCTNFCGGDSFLKPGENVLMAEPGDISTLAKHIITLLTFDNLRTKLAQEGRKTAETLDYSNTIPLLEKAFFAVLESKAETAPNDKNTI